MGISGIYASATQMAILQSSIGKINVKLETFKLNSENIEEKYEANNMIVMPSEIVSFIPKIENIGEDCYVRVKLLYINENIDAMEYITGLTNAWEKHGDFYYYKEILNSNEIVKLFDTIQIPENIDRITSDKNINLSINVEAVQEKNFEPDYTQEDPWLGIVPEDSSNMEYNIETNNNANITISYENDANSDVQISNNFLSDIKNIMPGDIYKDTVKIKNKDKKNAKYYLKLNLDGLNEMQINLLNEIDLEIKDKKGKDVYSGKIKNAENVLLGNYNIGEEDEFGLKILVPKDLSNKYSGTSLKINWIFSVDYNKSNKNNPKTGDRINIAITIFVLSSIGLVIVMLLDRREKNK